MPLNLQYWQPCIKFAYTWTEFLGYKGLAKQIYDEKEELGMANCSVIVKVSEDGASVSRTGDFSSKMYYKKGEATEFLYHTPYGKFPVILSTQEIKNNLNVMGGKLEIIYSVTINNEENYHVLGIEVKTEEGREI